MTPSARPPSPPIPAPAVRIATAGEALFDLVMQPDGRLQPHAGGAAYNLTRALARQAVGVVYLNPLSEDLLGRQLQAQLVQDGARLAHETAVRQPTSLALVQLDAQGQARYSFYREGVADRQTDAVRLQQLCDLWPALQMVCTGCLALAPADDGLYRPWLQAQRDAGRCVVVDINLRSAAFADLAAYRRQVLTAAAQADLLKASDEDLAALGLPGETALHQALALLHGSTASVLALTLGAAGAVLIWRHGKRLHLLQGSECAPVTVVDTIGAGDTFLGGLLRAWLDSADAQGCPAQALARHLNEETASRLLQHALASASLNVMQPGCQPPALAQVHQRMASTPVRFQTVTP